MRLIDADALKEKIEIEFNNNIGSYCDGLLGAKELIDKAPTVSIDWGVVDGDRTVYARPQGNWNYIQAGMAVCPFCGGSRRDNRVDHIAFCNKCGADMREGGAE